MAIDTRKIGFLRWESAVTLGRVIYYFPGWTRKGSIKRAERFWKDQSS